MNCATSLQQLPGFGIHRIAIACGVFDGVHRGHQEIIRTTIDRAQMHDAEPVVVTFHPHPETVVAPASAPERLYSRRMQLNGLSDLNVRAVVMVPFTKDLADRSAEDFIADLVTIQDLEIVAICAGSAWRFGSKARGDHKSLRRLGAVHGFEAVSVPELVLDGRPISSTRIRIALSHGDLGAVENMLGRRYSIMGAVAFGKGIATSDLHHPTANIAAENEAFPPYGVYAAFAVLRQASGSAERFPGVLYLGGSPTYLDQPPEKPFVEIHIFDFSEEIYGNIVEVELIEFIRPDERFDTVTDLREQIIRDVLAARSVLGRMPPG